MRLSPRLAALAALVRESAFLVDVGSDHGYLPLALLREGKIRRALATDINPGPLSSARAHAEALAAEDPTLPQRLALRQADGLAGLGGEIFPLWEASGAAVCDIVIAGMGGELIVSILEKADFVRHPVVRLLLGPMTKPEAVRRFLLGEGFSIETDLLVREEARLYPLLAAKAPAKAPRAPETPPTALTTLAGEAAFWRREDGSPDPLRVELFDRLRARTEAALAGKEKAGLDVSAELALLGELAAATASLTGKVPEKSPKGAKSK